MIDRQVNKKSTERDKKINIDGFLNRWFNIYKLKKIDKQKCKHTVIVKQVYNQIVQQIKREKQSNKLNEQVIYNVKIYKKKPDEGKKRTNLKFRNA